MVKQNGEMSMSEPVITLKGVQKNYGKHQVLDGVELQVNKGDIYGLIGRNGAGKTTIFKIILGLSDYQGGSLSINGSSDAEGIRDGRSKIGFFVGSNFFPYMNARQNLEYYRTLKGIKDKGEVDRVLEIAGLDKAKGKFKRYSLGMKQRLGIANAIMGNPRILILDEPTNGLDPQGIADVRGLIQRLNQEFGMTVVVSSHILGELQNTAHRFGIVSEGHILQEISTEDLQTKQNVIRIAVDDVKKAETALNAAGVKILSEVQETRTLEEFYFNLVGGKRD